MARPGIEPRTSDLRVRCPTDCATLPGERERARQTEREREREIAEKGLFFLIQEINSEHSEKLAKTGSNLKKLAGKISGSSCSKHR